ncbi:UvrD-helicase domain-containing protein [Bryobacter aggregatus]|uniref:UvrD-helicase domain-containing protein n=1 Tax=Bryobacter aggregatus TaxID=360054 RepID=UPI0004E24840|nr:UvrD-helicase domain-containing protein [Bryobacter aggregatus]
MALTPAQQGAVERVGQDVCVLAGPGSGKTSVLTERFAWLVEARSVNPRNILAITFTEKAAREIRERVSKRLRSSVDPTDLELAPISTMHGFCVRLLKEHAIAAGLDPAFDLWDERLASAELYASVEQVLNEASRNEKPAIRALFTTWNSPNLVRELCDLHQKIRAYTTEIPQARPPQDLRAALAEMLSIAGELAAANATTDASRLWMDKFRQWFGSAAERLARPDWEAIGAIAAMPANKRLPGALKTLAEPLWTLAEVLPSLLVSNCVQGERAYLTRLLERIFALYAQRKRAAARVDFQDLEHASIHLLATQPQIREELQRRYEHILMDEVQDTNPIQWQLVNLLRSPGSFFAVGDVNQSIYGFRFAAPAQFIAYRETLRVGGGVIDLLDRNFRSRSAILSFTEDVCSSLPGIEPFQLVAARQFQSDHTAVSLHPFEEEAEEQDWIAQEILALRDQFIVEPKGTDSGRALRYSDIAILVRRTRSGEQIAEALAARGIPYTLSGGQSFFDKQEVCDLISYLEVLANQTNEIASVAVRRSPLFGWSDDEILNGEGPGAYSDRLTRQRAQIDEVGPERFLTEAIDASGYLDSLAPDGQANVAKFLRLVREEWQRGARNLRAFVTEIQAIRQASNEKAAPLVDAGDAVQILTVHASKGLEFPVVFLASAASKASQIPGSLSYDPDFGIGVRWLNPNTGKNVADYEAERIKAKTAEREDAESQRLLFVALTRAEQKLYVSWAAKKRTGWLKHLDPYKDYTHPVEPDRTVEAAPEPPVAALERIPLRPLPPQPSRQSSTTPTDLAKFARCPRRYYLDRLAGLSAWQQRGDGDAAALGTAVHQILAGQLPEQPSAEAQQLADVFLASPLAARLKSARWVEREFDFVVAISDLVIEGQIDLVFQEPDGVITVVDYKTDATVSEHYHQQLAIYRAAIAKLFPDAAIRSYLHFLRTDTCVEAVAALDLSLLRKFADGLSYPTAAGTHCQRCPHLAGACPVGLDA